MKNLAFLALSLVACSWLVRWWHNAARLTASLDTLHPPRRSVAIPAPAVHQPTSAVPTACGRVLLHDTGAGVLAYQLAAVTATFPLVAVDRIRRTRLRSDHRRCRSAGPVRAEMTPAAGTAVASMSADQQAGYARRYRHDGTLPANRPAGNYFIVVGDSRCNLAPRLRRVQPVVSGTLPVKLQKFSVK